MDALSHSSALSAGEGASGSAIMRMLSPPGSTASELNASAAAPSWSILETSDSERPVSLATSAFVATLRYGFGRDNQSWDEH